MSQYVQMSQGEVAFLAGCKLGRTEWAVYCCLASHAHSKSHSFVPVDKIVVWIGGHIGKNPVEKALKKLEDKGALRRKGCWTLERWNLTYRERTGSAVAIVNKSPSKLEGEHMNSTSKLEGDNTSKMEGNNTSKLEGIKKKVKKKLKYNSIINEDCNKEISKIDVEDEILIGDYGLDGGYFDKEEMVKTMNKTWSRKALAIIYNYDWFVEATGKVFSVGDRNEILKIFQGTCDGDTKKLMFKKIYEKKYFGK